MMKVLVLVIRLAVVGVVAEDTGAEIAVAYEALHKDDSARALRQENAALEALQVGDFAWEAHQKEDFAQGIL